MNGAISNLSRGVYDQKVVSSVADKRYAGCAVDMKNFVADNDNTLKKRPGFRFLYEVSSDSWLIPFVYDDNQKYLMRFYNDPDVESGENPNRCSFYQYLNGNLLETSIGGSTTYATPTDGTEGDFVFDGTKNMGGGIGNFTHYYFGGFPVKPDFLTATVMDTIPNTDIIVEFPEAVYLSQVRYDQNGVEYVPYNFPGLYKLVALTNNWFNYSDMKLYGSNDGTDYVLLDNIYNTPNYSSIVNVKKNYVFDTAYKYYKLTITSIQYSNGHYVNAVRWFRNLQFTGTAVGATGSVESEISATQAAEVSYTNQYRRIVFAHKDIAPQEFTNAFAPLTTTGLDLEAIGNPTLARFYQERLLLAGFTNNIRQFNLSKAGDITHYTLNTTDVKATDPIQGTMAEQISKPEWAYSGRNILYLGNNDGVFPIQGGNGQPITATFLDAHLRLIKPCSSIPIVKVEDIGYFVGSDKQTIYAFDFDYSVDRMKAVSINDHCITKFRSGIKMMVACKGKTDYLYVLLEDGTIMACLVNKLNEFSNATSSLQQESLHAWFPISVDGEIIEITALQSNLTGEDSLFAILKNLNNVYTLQELEKFDISNAQYDWEDEIGGEGETTVETSDVSITLDGSRNDEGKYKIIGVDPEWGDAVKVVLEDSVGHQLTLTNLEKQDSYWYANTDTFPTLTHTYIKYYTTTYSWNNSVVTNLKTFQGENILFDNKYIIKQTRPSGYTITIDGTVNGVGKNLITVVGTVIWDDAVKVELFNADGSVSVSLTDLEYVTETETWWATVRGIAAPTDEFITYIKYKDHFTVPDSIIGLRLKAYEDGKLYDVTWEGSEMVTPAVMSEPIVGTTYDAEAKFANLSGIETRGKKSNIGRIGVQSIVSWGLQVGTLESKLSTLQSYGGETGMMQNMLFPMASYEETAIMDSSRLNKYLVIKQEIPYYCEVGFIMYDLKVGG